MKKEEFLKKLHILDVVYIDTRLINKKGYGGVNLEEYLSNNNEEINLYGYGIDEDNNYVFSLMEMNAKLMSPKRRIFLSYYDIYKNLLREIEIIKKDSPIKIGLCIGKYPYTFDGSLHFIYGFFSITKRIKKRNKKARSIKKMSYKEIKQSKSVSGSGSVTNIITSSCFICNGTGYYRDFNGIFHNCPKCNVSNTRIIC